MKGVVLEVRDGCSAILLEDGTVVKRPTTYGIGETVEVEASVAKMPTGRRLSRIVAAAAAFVVVFTGGGTYAYLDATAMSQVSLDVNPSLEYQLNHFDKVVSVRDENEDAKEVVELLNQEGVKGDSISEALAKTEDVLKDLGYLAEDEDPYILVSVCSGSQKKYAELTAEIESQLSSESYNVTVFSISEENKKEADELGLSGGRYAVMKSNEEKRAAADSDKKEDKAAATAMADPVEYYKTSAVRDLIEGISEDSLTIDDDDTIITEVADTKSDAKEESREQIDETVVASGTDDADESIDTTTTTDDASGNIATEPAATDTSATDTSDETPEVPVESEQPTDVATTDAGAEETVATDDSVTVTTEETVSTTEETEETVTSGDDEVDGDAPIDMSKLG